MATEVELKLHFPPEAAPLIAAHPLLAKAVPSGAPKRLDNTYFDTPKLTLNERKIALRIRKVGGKSLQTVKCAAESVAGLSSRPEWEQPYRKAFDFSAVSDEGVRSFLEAQRPELVPLFTTDFERRTWLIDLRPGVTIQAMLDVGQVTSGERSAPISELELELSGGSAGDLLDVALTLAGDLPLTPDDCSKAERGYALFFDRPASPQKFGGSPLGRKMKTAEAFQALARHGMQLWQANLLGTLTSNEDEFVHQYRVALRRLNTLLKVFRPALPEGFAPFWNERFKALLQATGDARDLDVMCESILRPILHDDDHGPLAGAALSACDEARLTAQADIERSGSGAAILLFSRQLQELPEQGWPGNFPRFAETRLDKLHTAALKRLRQAAEAPSAERAHRLRIALKHLRYAGESFAPLFGEDAMRRYVKAIAKLQDKFGFINDLHVAMAALDDWERQGRIPQDTRQSVAAWHTDRARKELTAALRLTAALLKRCPPWQPKCDKPALGAVRRQLKKKVAFQPG